MRAEVATRVLPANRSNPGWEVTLSVFEDGRCVFSADLQDGHHGRVWHVTYAEEIARRINARETVKL